MKYYLHSIGCRLNQGEMEALGRQLLAAGHELAHAPEAAEQIVLNTCAVTTQATRDTHRQARRYQRVNPAAPIVLTGCHATLEPAALAHLPGVIQVTPNQDKARLIQILDPTASQERPGFDYEPALRDQLATAAGHTRAFVKVQDGCNNRCTFCITTVARGAGVSRPLRAIVEEIYSLMRIGYQEVVLTGVHLGSYGHDQGQSAGLRQLVTTILTETDLPRLRLSSLEPWDLTPGFFRLWENPRLLPHLHLPLQAGCDRTLRRMARKTTRASFHRLATAARLHIPQLQLSTDIICGFPGETEADFQTSLDYVEEIGFGRLHVFAYSPRPGTAAARMSNQTAPAECKARVQRMLALGQRLSLAFHRQQVGRMTSVLWETPSGADDAGLRWQGYSDNYIRVTAYGPPDLHNRITFARLTTAEAGGMGAVLVKDEIEEAGVGGTPVCQMTPIPL